MTTCQLAAVRGDLEALKQARSEGAGWDGQVCELAAENGHLDLLKWAHLNSCPWDERVCSAAARNGHLALLQWARSEGCPWDSRVCYEAATGGHVELFKWVCSEGCPWDESIACAQASEGQTEIVKWAFETGRPLQEACEGAAGSGNLELLKWLRSKESPWDKHACARRAAVGKHWEVVKWMRSIGFSVRLPVLSAAILSGDIELLQWADENGCGWLDRDEIVFAAASHGHFEMVKWLHSLDEDLINTRGCCGAAIAGHLEMLKWLHSRGCAWDEEVWEEAARKGSLEVLKWARESLWDKPELDPSAAERWFFDDTWQSESSPWNDELVCITAAQEGHLHVLKWAVANGARLTELVSMAAAEYGQLEVLMWARSQNPPCPYPDDEVWFARRSGGKEAWPGWTSPGHYTDWPPRDLDGLCASFAMIDGCCKLTEGERVGAEEVLDKHVALVLCLRKMGLGGDMIGKIGKLAGLPLV